MWEFKSLIYGLIFSSPILQSFLIISIYLLIISPFKTILSNAGIDAVLPKKDGYGIDVITGKEVNMITKGIIDPVLVTKSALKNAVSVAKTIMSADCIISNRRVENASG